MNLLDRPAVGDESGREPVEQFGVAGRFARTPKFDGVATIPRPKWCCQIRLTMTRAVSGLSAVSTIASSSRPLALR